MKRFGVFGGSDFCIRLTQFFFLGCLRRLVIVKFCRYGKQVQLFFEFFILNCFFRRVSSFWIFVGICLAGFFFIFREGYLAVYFGDMVFLCIASEIFLCMRGVAFCFVVREFCGLMEQFFIWEGWRVVQLRFL